MQHDEEYWRTVANSKKKDSKMQDVKLTNQKFVNLFERTLSDGRKWTFASRRENTSDNSTKADAVFITAGKEINGVPHVLLCEEYRPITGCWVYSFIAGCVDEGETVEQAAVRECFEESGLTLTDPKSFFNKTYPSSPGLTDERIAYVDGNITGEIKNESENIRCFWASPDDIIDIVESPSKQVSAQCIGMLMFIFAGITLMKD